MTLKDIVVYRHKTGIFSLSHEKGSGWEPLPWGSEPDIGPGFNLYAFSNMDVAKGFLECVFEASDNGANDRSRGWHLGYRGDAHLHVVLVQWSSEQAEINWIDKTNK